jgi:hypothetical protein
MVATAGVAKGSSSWTGKKRPGGDGAALPGVENGIEPNIMAQQQVDIK